MEKQHFTAFIAMCCQPKLVSNATKSSCIKSSELTKDVWSQLRATVQLNDQDYHNRIKKILIYTFEYLYAVFSPSGTVLVPVPLGGLTRRGPGDLASEDFVSRNTFIACQTFFHVVNLIANKRIDVSTPSVEKPDVKVPFQHVPNWTTSRRILDQKKDLAGALKHLQLHKSNIQMTTNVNTPLNKTLLYKVSTGPRRMTRVQASLLCSQNDRDWFRSGLVLLTQTGLSCIHALFFNHQQNGDNTQNTVSKE